MWYSHAKKNTFLLLLYSSTTALFGQIAGADMPVGPTDVYDWRAVRVNPAIAGLQSGAFEVGYRVFYAGFADAGTSLLKSGYMILNVPRRLPWELSGGLTTTIFSTPILKENEIHFFLSKRVSPYITMGFSCGAFNINYQTDRFFYDAGDVVDDPVFAGGSSLWKFDMGLGLTYTPTSSIIIGLGVQHLTRPNISLIGDDVYLNPTLTLGLKFHIDRVAIHTTASVDRIHSGSGTILQMNHSELGTAHLGIDNNQIWTRGRLNVRGPFSFAYGMYFPINDFAGQGAGSHEIAFIYEFDRQLRKFSLSEDPEDWQEFLPPMPTIRVEPQIIVWADGNENVDIISKTIIRDLKTELDSTARSRLTPFDLGLVDSINSKSKTTHFEPHKYSNLEKEKTPSKEYVVGETSVKFLDNLAVDLRNDSTKSAYIVSPNSSDEREYLMGEYLQEQQKVPRERFGINEERRDINIDNSIWIKYLQDKKISKYDKFTFALPDTLVITVFPIDSSMNAHPWTFVVENMEQDTVFSVKGKCSEIRKVKWDWRGTDGNIIPYGFYKYYISWVDHAGRLRQSSQRIIYARQLESKIYIEISKDYPQPDEKDRVPGLLLNK